MSAHLAPLEKYLGYEFKDYHLLHRALTHSSFSAERNVANYERLEFLGDTVLGLTISHFLFTQFPDESEGDLSKRRSALVCGRTLAEVAEEIHLGEFIQISENEEYNGGRHNPTILEDVVEALIGAVFIDGGFDAAQTLVNSLFTPFAEKYTTPPQDPKTGLQEWSQQQGLPIPDYKVVQQTGPSHAPTFVIEVHVKGCDPVQGEGTNKRKAERVAAANMLNKIRK